MRRYLLAFCLLWIALPVFAQTNPITNGGFEQLDASGFPSDWGRVGEKVEVTTEAHTGRYALRFERGRGAAAPPEVGLNRAWQANSGQQGSMLAQTKGAIRFWYKVVSADPDAEISIQVIPMSARAWEDTGSGRVIYRISPDLAGQEAWREGRLVYDLSDNPKVKWVHIGVRLTGGSATLLVDDFEYVERIGAVLQVGKVHLYHDARQPERAARLTAMVENAGDSASDTIRVRLRLPQGVSASPLEQTLEAQPVGGAKTLHWQLRGALRPGEIRIEAREGASSTDYLLRLAPRLEIVSLLVGPSLSPPGGAATVTATLENRGTCISEGGQAVLNAPGGVSLLTSARQNIRPLPPGKRVRVVWRARMPRELREMRFQCEVRAPNVPPMTARAVAAVTDALLQPPVKVIASLRTRTGRDRTVGELWMPGAKSPAARLPHLGKVITRLPDGSVQTLYARMSGIRLQKGASGMTSRQRDRAGGVWTFSATATPVSSKTTRLSLSARCDKPRALLVFEGPMLLAGEGGTKDRKTDALFPGLEWLTAEEESSSDLDIAASHPERPRFAPHPHKVTIPVMGVRTPVATVGLLWDAHQRWDGTQNRPQPVYAVPDRFTGAAAHRMGLIAPNVLNGLPENALEAKPGYRLAAHRPLTLTALLYADPNASDSLAAMDEWFRRFRFDPVLPAPKGSDRAQIAWSMQAYLKTLWVSPQEGWLPFLGGPGIWRKPAFQHAHAYDLSQAALILPNHPDAPAWRERVREVLPRIGHPQGDDLGFAFGDPLPQIGGNAGRAYQLMASQEEDGSWIFDADRRDEGVFVGMDYHLLGTDGGKEVGTVARNAYEILLYARLTGDESAYRAGVKSLEFMRRYSVPRAAQVWEVPFHTPDILAAADAVDAYLEAYRYTCRNGQSNGDPRWLREAQRWARAGLPFVYVWNAPGKPWMRYGSIPVFGATWFQGSWFGNLVQWNGLRYAYAILKLYEYDREARWGGQTWRDIAQGVTRSAMYQQSPLPKNLALWPDALHTITNMRADWDFAPRQILKNVYALLERTEEPRTVTISAERDRPIRISTGGRIVSARWNASTLKVETRYHPMETNRIVVAGITRPARVLVNGRALPQLTGTQEADGWRYDETRGLLAMPVAAEKAVVEVRGARPMQMESRFGSVVKTLNFSFDRGVEGWIAANDIALLETQQGRLLVRVTGGDPYLQRYLCQIRGSAVREAVIRIRGSGDGGGQLFWTTLNAPDWNEQKSMRFVFPTDGAWHEVAIPVGDHPAWKGQTISALRLDPGSTRGSRIEIDWIRGR
jgi:hypothetical protein